ncbi:MAG: hypothetical protein ACOYEG_12820 [Petrimonas sp.]|jgi:hypothetical protein
MKQDENRPAVANHQQGVLSFEVQDKDKPKLSKRQKKVYDLLCTGKHSAADITIQLGFCDPRSYIREIRDKGVVVLDEWVEKEDVRFKRYWVYDKRVE